jgi:hypothetical protein
MQRATFTIVCTTYHSLPDTEPISIDCRYTRKLDTIEQTYTRHTVLDASKGWVKLDTGWVEKASILIIRNNKPSFSKIPTQEQRDEIDSRIVQISFNGTDPHLEVRVGEHSQLFPLDLSKIWLRCVNSIAKVSVIVIPS